MVGQNLDDPAVGDLAALALHDHALELPLEGLQARDPRLNKPELRAGYRIGGFAGLRRMIRQAEQLPDRVEREAELPPVSDEGQPVRSEEHTSELQSLMRNSYAVFCLKKKKNKNT